MIWNLWEKTTILNGQFEFSNNVFLKKIKDTSIHHNFWSIELFESLPVCGPPASKNSVSFLSLLRPPLLSHRWMFLLYFRQCRQQGWRISTWRLFSKNLVPCPSLHLSGITMLSKSERWLVWNAFPCHGRYFGGIFVCFSRPLDIFESRMPVYGAHWGIGILSNSLNDSKKNMYRSVWLINLI